MTYSPFTTTPNFETLLGHRRVSSSQTLFSFNSFRSNIDLGQMDSVLTNGGTVTHNNTSKSHVLSVTTTTGSKAVFQQHYYNIYQPARPMRFITAFTFGAAAANIRRRVGIFDDNDGVFLEQNGTTDVALTVRTSISGTPANLSRVAQGSWNIDPLNGTGPSGVTINWAFDQFICIDYLWLGIGPIRISFLIGGELIPVHIFDFSNSQATKHMKTGSLPARVSIENLGGGAASTFLLDCVTVDSEGGDPSQSIPLAQQRAYIAPSVSVHTSETAVLAVRIKTTVDGDTNRNLILFTGLSLYSENKAFNWRVYVNPTITGGTWSDAFTGSLAEVNSTITSFSGGTLFDAGTVYKRDPQYINSENTFLSVNASGTAGDVFLLTCQSLSSSTNIYSSVRWKEITR